MQALADSLRLISGPYRPGDLDGYRLVFAATNNPEVNAAVFAEAEASGLIVNTADDPEHCRFLVPATFDCGPIRVAVSTGGASPALAREVCAELEAALPSAYGAFVELLGRLRPELQAVNASPKERSARLAAVLNSDVFDLVASGRGAEAERSARRILGLEDAE